MTSLTRTLAAVIVALLIGSCAPAPPPSTAPSVALTLPSATPSASVPPSPSPSDEFPPCAGANRSAHVDQVSIVQDNSIALGLYLATGNLVSDMCDGDLRVSLEQMIIENATGLHICALAAQTAVITERWHATPFPFTLGAGDQVPIAIAFRGPLPPGEVDLFYDERLPVPCA